MLRIEQTIRLIRFLSIALLCILLVPLLVALALQEYSDAAAFVPSVAAVLVLTIVSHVAARKKEGTRIVTIRTGYLLVVFGALLVVFLSALPYALSGQGYSASESWLESASNWTTTGARVKDYGSLSIPLLLWKALSCWAGGFSMIILTSALLPRLGISDQMLSYAEDPVISHGRSMSYAFLHLMTVAFFGYVTVTAAAFALLLTAEYPPVYALMNAMSSVSTTGVIDPTAGGALAGPSAWAVAIFTAGGLFGSINILLIFALFSRKSAVHGSLEETKTFLRAILVSAAAIFVLLLVCETYRSPIHALGSALSMTASFASTTGFTTVNIGKWPTFCKFLLICLSIIGGCSYSASGGIKVSRAMIAFKTMLRGVYKRIHPQAMRPVVVKDHPISAQRVSSITVYVFLFFAAGILGFVLLGIDNLDLETTVCASFASLTNTGAGFGLLTGSDYRVFSPLGQFVASFLMITGRLEIYPVLFLFSRSFWIQHRNV